MLRFEGKQRVLNDNFNEDSGWLPLSIRSQDLKVLIGQDVKAFILIDDMNTSDPRQMIRYKVKYLPTNSEYLSYEVTHSSSNHKVILKVSCDCEFCLKKGLANKIPCSHILNTLHAIVKNKQYPLDNSTKGL